jgi:catechol 2,3-dioxygenase-like lactoylglutathione lyase family enzyme
MNYFGGRSDFVKQDQSIASVCFAAVLVFSTGILAAEQGSQSDGTAGKDQREAIRGGAAEEVPLHGYAHVGIQVSDLKKSRKFYHDLLGFEEVFNRRTAGSQDVEVAFFKVNDRQFIELLPGLRPEQPAPMRYVGMYTDDIARLHEVLQHRGLAPGEIGKSPEGNLNFSIRNPAGLDLSSMEFVQYMPGSQHSTALGKRLSDRRMGTRVDHVGLVASNLDTGRKFLESLGFRVKGAKKRPNGEIFGYGMDLPGTSGEHLELSPRPRPYDRKWGGTLMHFSLGVPDIVAAYRQVAERGAKLEPLLDPHGKYKEAPFLLFDPDRTRVEF